MILDEDNGKLGPVGQCMYTVSSHGDHIGENKTERNSGISAGKVSLLEMDIF